MKRTVKLTRGPYAGKFITCWNWRRDGAKHLRHVFVGTSTHYLHLTQVRYQDGETYVLNDSSRCRLDYADAVSQWEAAQ